MTYIFGEFTLAPATWYDQPLAYSWVMADPDHSKTTPATFWTHQSATTNSFLLSRGEQPVFFFRIDERPAKQIEVHIQFDGPNSLRKSLTRRGITEGFQWLEKMLIDSGFEGYYFHSRNTQLIFFCQNHLGFEWDGTKLYRDLRKMEKIREKNEGDSATSLLDSLLGEGASTTILGG